MGQDSPTSSGSKETGIALPGEHEIEPVVLDEFEDNGLSGPRPASNLVLPRGLSSSVQVRPDEALRSATNL